MTTETKFYQNLDLIGGDLEFVGRKPFEELMQIALSKPNCIAFNTLGFLKHTFNENKLQPSKYFDKDDGLYVILSRTIDKPETDLGKSDSLKNFIMRFDLTAKYLYVKNLDKCYQTNFYIDLYKAHIITFNNAWEYPGDKSGIDEFVNNYDKLITSIKQDGFNKNHPIPVGRNGLIINGAHRLATSVYYDRPFAITLKDELGWNIWNYNFFINHKERPLDLKYADTMALETIKLDPHMRCMIINPITFSSDLEKIAQIKNIIQQFGTIYYYREFELTRNGYNNLVKEMYRGEYWIGGIFPPGWSPGGKAQASIGPVRDTYKVAAVVFHINDMDNLITLKEKCRSLYNFGKNSLHVTDFTNDTFRVASSLLNKNSLFYLNHGSRDISTKSSNSLEKYFCRIESNSEDYCLTSSIVLELFGLRNAGDIDYLHRNNHNIEVSGIDVHQGKWLSYYHKPIDELLFNPDNYFYVNGHKILTLDNIYDMKLNRGEPKDLKDCELIHNFLTKLVVLQK